MILLYLSDYCICIWIAIHSLQYLTAVTAGVNFTIAMVDGQQFLYYSSSNNRMIVAEWMKAFYSSSYWERETQRFSGEQNDLHHHLTQVVKLLDLTAGKNKHFYTINLLIAILYICWFSVWELQEIWILELGLDSVSYHGCRILRMFFAFKLLTFYY